MADRTVSVRLQAEVAGFVSGMRTAKSATDDFVTRNRRELELVGRGLVGIGTAAIAGLGLATKAAIDWESAWAGVQKTVDGSAAQMGVLEGELRDMAKSLPATHEEIAAVAEAAGQLGVKRDDVAEFTKTMIDLGETTNLSAEEAAVGLARFSNIMGTAHGDVDRLGSVLVDLGNNSATTEREILELGTRLAAAGKIAGLSEADVLGFAATLTSVGVEAEAGGTALSKVFTSVRDAVLDGGEQLETFARVAGTTASDFATAFQRDPAEAIAMFIAGLGRMNEAGQSTTGVFEELELTDQRLMRALLSTASAGDLLTDALELGSDAWTENSALTEEAQKRYETAAAQISMAWNSIRDAAIEVGSVIAPIVADIAGAVGDLADKFGELPEGVQTAVVAATGLVGFASLAGGALLLFAPRIVETRRALQTLGVTTGRTGTAIRGIGRVAGIAAGGLAALMIAQEIGRMFKESEADLRRYAERVETIGGPAVEDKIRALKAEIEELDSITEDAANTDLGFVNIFWSDWSGNAVQAADRADHLRERLAELEHQKAMEAVQSQQTGGAVDELTGDFEEQVSAVDTLTEELQAYQDELRAITDPVFAVMSALESVEDAQSAYNEAVKEHGEESDEARRASVDLAQAVADMEQAVLDGDLSWEDFDATLKRWVEQGVLTEDQAEAIRTSTDEAREAAEDYEGEYPAELRVERDKAAEAEAQRKLDAIAAARTARVAPNLDGRRYGAVESDLNTLARPRFATINVGYAVTGSGLPAGLTRGHSGGMVTSRGVIPRFHDGGSLGGLAGDEVPAILQTGEVVLSRMQVDLLARALSPLMNSPVTGGRFHNGGTVGQPGTVGLDWYLGLLSRGVIRLDDVTGDEWETLKRLGWQGKAGDRMEALYPPLEGVRREYVRFGEVTNAEWQRLMDLGWSGRAGDHMEALYPPLKRLAGEIDKQAELLRDANLSRIGASGKKRTWDFFRSGGRSYAHIFATGETLALDDMGEQEAYDYLKRIGKFHDGGLVSGPGGPRDDRINARLSNGEFVVNARAVQQVGLSTMTAINQGRTPQPAIQMPRELIVRDVNGELVGRMRVEAAGVMDGSSRTADLYARTR